MAKRQRNDQRNPEAGGVQARILAMIFGLLVLLGVGVGTNVEFQRVGNIKSTLAEGAKRVSDSIRVNGCVTQTDQTNILHYLNSNGMDPTKVYFNASTSRQSYGSTAGNGAIGYNFPIKLPFLNLHYDLYLENEIPNVNSDYVAGKSSDKSVCLGSFSEFGGTQTASTDLGPTPIADVTNPAFPTSVTLTGPNTVTVGQSVQYSGVVNMGSTLAPAGTQVEVSSPNGVMAVSTQADGSFVVTVSFPSVGPQLLAAKAGIGTASQTVTVTVSAPAQIILTNTSGGGSVPQSLGFHIQSVTTDPSNYQTIIGTSVTIQGMVVDANGNPISSASMNVTADTPDVPNQTVKTNNQGAFNLTYTPKSLGMQHVTFTIGAAVTTASVDILQGTPQTITLQSSTGSTYSSSPLTITAGQSINFKGSVIGLYNSPISGVTVAMASLTDGLDNFVPNGTITTDEWGSYSNPNIVLTQAGTQYIQSFTAGINTPAQIQVNVNPGVAAKVANLTANPTQIGAGGTVIVTGQIQDGYGNPVQTATAITLVGPDTTTNVTTQSGGQFTAAQKVSTPGMATLKVQYTGTTLSGGTMAVNVLPTGAYSLTVNTSVSSVSASGSLTATITLKDNTGTPISGKSITLSESPEPSALVTTQVTTDAGGQAVVTIAPVTKVGYESITATMDGVSNVIGTATFQVVPGVANQVVASVSPSFTQVNPPVAPTATGTLMDAYGNIISNATVSISGGYGPSNSGTTDVNGNFNITLQAKSVGIWPLTITSGSWSTNPSGITLTVSALVNDTMALSFASGSTVVGQSVQATATLTDASGKPVQGETVTFNTPGDTISVLSPQSATTDSQGMAVTNVTFTKVGTDYLVAQYQNVAVSATETVTQMDLTTQSAAQLAGKVKVNNLTISPLVCGVNPPSAANYPIITGQLVDQYNNPMSNISLQLSGGWGGSASATTSLTGYFSASIDPVNIGTFFPTIVSGNFVYTSNTVNLNVSSHQSYYQIAINTPSSTTVGLPTSVTYTITDQSNNPISNITPIITSIDAGSVVSALAPSDSSGHGTFKIAFDTTGIQVVNLTYQGVQASAAINVIPIDPQNPPPGVTVNYSFIQNTLSPTIISTGQKAILSGKLVDNFSNPIPNAIVAASTTGNWGVTPSTTTLSDGTFAISIIPTVAGTFPVSLATGSISPISTGLALTVSTTQGYTMSFASSTNPASAGAAATYGINLVDQAGNPVVGVQPVFSSPTDPSAGSVTGPATNGSGNSTISTFTFNKAGFQILQVTWVDQPNVSCSMAVTVNPGDPAQIVSSSLSPSQVQVGSQAVVTGLVEDVKGNEISGTTVTISGGYGSNSTAITGRTGTFTALITASNVGTWNTISIADGSASATVGPLTVIPKAATLTLTPLMGTPIADLNNAFDIVANVKDGSGTPIQNASVTFTVSPNGLAAFSANPATTDVGGNASPTVTFSQTGDQTITANCIVNGQSLSAKMYVYVSTPVLGTVAWTSVTPTTVTAGSPVTITGQALDQFGHGMPDGTAIALSMPGSNAVNTTVYTYHSGIMYGLFSGSLSPTKAGNWTLYAVNGSISVPYPTGISVTSGAPSSGILTPVANVIYKTGSNFITATSLKDSYLNICTGSYTLTESYMGTFSGFTASPLPIILDSNGNGSVITPALNQVYGQITYAVGSLSCSFNIWMNPDYRTAGGSQTSYALDSSGKVWSWGYGSYGQLGNGSYANSPTPVQVSNLSGIVSVAGGNATGYALDSSGHVWAWGDGYDCELGNGTTTTNQLIPVQVSNLSGIVAISGGSTTGYALDSNGHVWSWGCGSYGQLGNGWSSGNSLTPVQILNLTNIVAISGGGNTGYALDSSGHVWAWGDGGDGELGNGTTSNSTTPVQVSNLTGIVSIGRGFATGYALDLNGHAWAWGNGGYGQLGNGLSSGNSLTPVQILNLTNIVAISGGDYTGYALDSSGQVWAWGNAYYGQLGNGLTSISSTPVHVSNPSTIVAISGGGATGYALDSLGKVWAWGANNYGQFGNGGVSNSSVPLQTSQSGWIVPMP